MPRYTQTEREVAALCGYHDRSRFENAHPGMKAAFDHNPYPAGTDLSLLWREGWNLADSEMKKGEIEK